MTLQNNNENNNDSTGDEEYDYTLKLNITAQGDTFWSEVDNNTLLNIPLNKTGIKHRAFIAYSALHFATSIFASLETIPQINPASTNYFDHELSSLVLRSIGERMHQYLEAYNDYDLICSCSEGMTTNCYIGFVEPEEEAPDGLNTVVMPFFFDDIMNVSEDGNGENEEQEEETV